MTLPSRTWWRRAVKRHAKPHALTPAQRAAIAVGGGAVVLVAFTASLMSLTELARDDGWANGTAWMLPVCIDGIALVAWVCATAGAGWRAWLTGWVATAVSVVGNVMAHGAWAACPPLALAVGVHLIDAVMRPVSVPELSDGVCLPPVAAPSDAHPTPKVSTAPRAVSGDRRAATGSGGGVVAPDVVVAACEKFGLAAGRAPEVAAVVAKARREGVSAIVPLRDKYGCPHSVARAANAVLRASGVAA